MNSRDSQKAFVLTGDLNAILWKLSIPAVAAMMLFGLNAFMDTVYIGQLLDSTALAGVALAYPLTSIMMGFGTWVGTGAGNMLSIALGENDVETQERILGNTTLFVLVSSVLFAVPCWIYAEDMISLMGGRGAVLDYGVRYFKVALLAAPIWVYGLGLNFIIRAEGKLKEAAFLMSYGLIVNLILTPIFISYFDMGIEGAAWATNIGMLIYSITGYRYFKKGRASFAGNIDTLAYVPETLKDIARLGFPGFIMSAMGLLQAFIVFNTIVEIGNDDDLAFYAAVHRTTIFLLTPLFGLMRAMQPVVGINYGARQYDRVVKAFWLFCKVGFYIMAPFWFFMTIFPDTSLRLLLPEAIFSGQDIWHFRVYIMILPIVPFVFMCLTYLPAVDRPRPASIITMARQVFFYIPVMLLLPKWIGISGIYYGTLMIDVIITIWFMIVVWRSFQSFGVYNKVSLPNGQVH